MMRRFAAAIVFALCATPRLASSLVPSHLPFGGKNASQNNPVSRTTSSSGKSPPPPPRMSAGDGDDSGLNKDSNGDEREKMRPSETTSAADMTEKLTAESMGLADGDEVENAKRRNLIINVAAGGVLAASGVATGQLYFSEVYTPAGFQRIRPTQFIAALGDPESNQGAGAEQWGIWRVDPGPRGVYLRDYDVIEQAEGVAPRGWKFDRNDWWLEEHGIIMESPSFPLRPGRYLVTGGRMVTTGLTVAGDGSWKLDDGAKLYDVTHLPCRSARYRPVADDVVVGDNAAPPPTPRAANLRDFPVSPGAQMPPVPGFRKQDYAVLFVVGKAA